MAGVLIFALGGYALVFDHQRLDSATMDESMHTLAGAEYVLGGTYAINLEHPPLAKLLAGLSLRLGGARPQPDAVPSEAGRFQFVAPVPPQFVYQVARRPFPLLFACLVVVAAAVAWRWGGPVAGAGTAALVAFEPNLVAHAGVVHTDVPLALGFAATLLLVLIAFEKRSVALWGAAGVLLGLSMAAKFSAVFLPPLLLLVVLVRILLDARAERRRRGVPVGADLVPLGGFALASCVALAVLWGSYAVPLRSMGKADAERAVRRHLTERKAPPELVERAARLSRLSPEAGHYAAGLLGIAVQNRLGGGVNYLKGKLSVEGFWDYFFVAFGVKSSLGFLLVLLSALLLAFLRRPGPLFVSFTLLLPVAYLFLAGSAASYNIGIRHMLPAYPLLAAAAALVLVRALTSRAAGAVLALGATLQLGETLRVHPHELAFFNALAGGPAQGEKWLNDSNLDWGQDLARLGLELSKRGCEAETTIAYHGGADPLTYSPRARIFDAREPLKPGLYAVSSFLLSAGPEMLYFHGDRLQGDGYERLRRAVRTRGEPLGRVGYSILLYRIPEERAFPR